MALPPKISELDFIRLTKNHREWSGSLGRLGHSSASTGLLQQAEIVALCWYRLGQEHLVDARFAEIGGRFRSAYSRAYYAAYNASKALRYFAQGYVSLLGDDHKKAGIDLPDDFPQVEQWSQKITLLLEYRQRADYDNWSGTVGEFALSAAECCDIAEQFIHEVAKFFDSKFGVKV